MAKLELFELYCQPGARKTRVVGQHDGRVKVALASLPVEGQANAMLIKFLAVTLGVCQSEVRIVAGMQSRYKRVAVSGMSADEALTKLLAPSD